MYPKLLIDSIVQQTTVLIAQLSTAAGIRAPLAHVADQVFVSLAREIEAQGVGRKVVADMFGVALRTYQKKVQRLAESVTVRERTLWEAVLDFITESERVTRSHVLERFEKDCKEPVAAVLGDLVGSGLVSATGRGDAMLYAVTSEADRRELSLEHTRDSLVAMVWARIYREPGVTVEGLGGALGVAIEAIREAVDELVGEGRVSRDAAGDAAKLRAETLEVAVGSAIGWEGAVYDHFRAVATAIASKVRAGPAASHTADLIGGTTLSFDLHPGHPYHPEVCGTLSRVRADLNALWSRVSAHNREHPAPEHERTKVTFYFGQHIEPVPEPEPADARATELP